MPGSRGCLRSSMFTSPAEAGFPQNLDGLGRLARGLPRFIKAEPSVIITFHDGFNARGDTRAETVDVVRMTVDGLLRRGYRLVTVDQLLGVPAYGPASPAAKPDPSRDLA